MIFQSAALCLITATLAQAAGVPQMVVEQPAGKALVSSPSVVAWGDFWYGQSTVPSGLTGVVAIAAGGNHTVALKANGTVVAWGNDEEDQCSVPKSLTGVKAIAAGSADTYAVLANGTVRHWGNPEIGVPEGLTGVKAVAAGQYHALVLKDDGTVFAWGSNNHGQTNVPVGLAHVTAVAAGESHSVALKDDGTVVAWGYNGYGQTTVPSGLADVQAVAAGNYFTLALKRDGSVVAWGINDYGQTKVPAGLANVQAIAAGGAHALALKGDGTVVAWGLDSIAQRTSVPNGLKKVTAIAAGGGHSVVLGTLPPVVDFGNQRWGTSGLPVTFTIKNTGTADLTLGAFTANGDNPGDFKVSAPAAATVPAGGSTTFTITFVPSGLRWRSATLHMASNDSSQSPFDLTLTGTSTCPAITVSNPSNVTGTVGFDFSERFTQSGGVGFTYFGFETGRLPTGLYLSGQGELSGRPTEAGSFPITVSATDDNGCRAFSATYKLVIQANASLNDLKLSTGTLSPAFARATTSYAASVPNEVLAITVTPTVDDSRAKVKVNGVAVVSGSASKPIALKVGVTAITVVVTASDGRTTKSYVLTVTRAGVPRFVMERPGGDQIVANRSIVSWGQGYQRDVAAGLTNVRATSTLYDHTLALLNDGTVAAWGKSSEGQTKVPAGLKDVQAVAAGGYHSVALKTNGTVVAWGLRNYGQTTVPKGLTGVQAIAAGMYHTVALKSDGTVVAWGYNCQGQTDVPIGLTNVQAIAAGEWHTVALKNDGTVVVWGSPYTVPSGLTDVRAIAAGAYHTVALKSDGTVVAWGLNDQGQTDVPIGLTDVQAIEAGGYHTVALKSDGTVAAWGWNKFGQTSVPGGLQDVKAISAGDYYAVAVKREMPSLVLYSQVVGTPSLPQTFTIRNTGTADLALGSITTDGTHPGDFSVSATASSSLAPGASTTFSVTFTPGALGIRSAVIHIPSNDSQESPFSLNLVGAGIIRQPHLEVERSTGVPVVGSKSLVTWGWNGYGQTSVPSHPMDVKAVAAGGMHTLALMNDGTVMQWAYAGDMPKGLSGVQAIAAGDHHSVALKSDGTVVVWNYSSDYPCAKAPRGLTNVKAITAGYYFTAALKTNGTVVIWDIYGGPPIVPSVLKDVEAIAAGDTHLVALKRDGTVISVDMDGSLIRNMPPGLSGVKAIAAGSYHSVALKIDGTVVAWGANEDGQTNVPSELKDVQAIAASWGNTTALKRDGTVVVWGYKGSQEVTAMPDGLRGVEAIASANLHTVALVRNAPTIDLGSRAVGTTISPMTFTVKNTGTADLVLGSLTVTGRNPGDFAVSRPATNTLPPGASTTFTATFSPSGIGWRNASVELASNDATASPWRLTLSGMGTVDQPRMVIEQPVGNALASHRTVVAWGNNESGQTSVPHGLTGVRAISAGYGHSVALKTDGTVVAWGLNEHGQIQVPTGLTGVQAIAAGAHHTVALKQDGTVVAWGNGTSGQTNVPTWLTGVRAIAAGGGSTFALKGDGSIVAWGDYSGSPTTVPYGLTAVESIAAGYSHAAVLKRDGTVTTWGWPSATRPPNGIAGGQAIAAGTQHDVLLKTDGTVVAWGWNESHQVDVPVGLTDVQAVAAGAWHSLALKRDGSVVVWGSNSYGQRDQPAGLKNVQAIASNGFHCLALVREPPSVAISSQDIGKPVTFTIRNTGPGDLILGPIRVNGRDFADFAVSAPASSTVQAGGSTTFTATFVPSGDGPRQATIHLTSNDPIDPTLDIDLNGLFSCPTITVTNPATSAAILGNAFSQAFMQTGSNGIATFQLASGSLPAGLTLSSTGVLSGTPLQTGSFPVTISTTDIYGCTGKGRTWLLKVAHYMTNEDSSSAAIHFTVPNGATLTATSSNPALVANEDITLGGSGTDRTLSIKPKAHRNGLVTITVAMSDGSTRTFDFVVAPVNDVPAALGPQIGAIVTTAPATVSTASHFTDPDTGDTPPDILTYSAVADHPESLGTSWGVDAKTGILTLTTPASGAREGEVLITVTVTDSQGTSASAVVRFNVGSITAPIVTPPATPPMLNRRTGLYEWLLNVRNPNPVSVTGYDLLISGLPAKWAVWNPATNKAMPRNPSGQWVLHHGVPVPAGTAITHPVTFYNPNRVTSAIKPVMTTVVVPSDAPPGAGSFSVPVLNVEKQGSNNLVTFQSTPGQRYQVFHFKGWDRLDWLAVPALVYASGTTSLFLDDHPFPSDSGGQYFIQLVVP